ncbi:Trp biosynthesis-associated membrane protein [Rothia sp. CCM 9419]|uniref:Trp biosynthesis-associated membrane protein n=1 Tax=Rothia sp. CCM 9419 TaxID=3402662 RepID=UPI003AEA857A
MPTSFYTRLNAPKTTFLTLLCAAITFGSTLPSWIDVRVNTSLLDSTLHVAGSEAAPAVSSLSLVALAGMLVIRLASTRIARIVAVLLSLTGVGMCASVISVLTNPVSASTTPVGKATGLSQVSADYTITFWPWASFCGAILIIILGIYMFLAVTHWPKKRKYDRTTHRIDDEIDDIDTWDSLSAGVDPTARS